MWEVNSEVNSELILVNSEVNSGQFSIKQVLNSVKQVLNHENLSKQVLKPVKRPCKALRPSEHC